MDWIAPAVIGIGFYFIYEAWQSHVTGTTPSPVAKITAAIHGASSSSVAPLPSTGPNQPSVTNYGGPGQVNPGYGVQPN